MRLTIPTPCTQDWDAMTPAGQGRHCSTLTNILTRKIVLKSNMNTILSLLKSGILVWLLLFGWSGAAGIRAQERNGSGSSQVRVASDGGPVMPLPLYDYQEKLFKELIYPREAITAGISGIVYVSCNVEKDGTLQDIQVTKGIGYGCDEEAVRLVKSLPPWRPGKIDGKATSMRITIPIRFKLPDPK